jgi:hypothetical protein
MNEITEPVAHHPRAVKGWGGRSAVRTGAGDVAA